MSEADEDQGLVTTESLCTNCHKMGESKFLTRVGNDGNMFVVASFSCPHCLWTNNELMDASSLHDLGENIRVLVKTSRDLTRKVILTEWASICVEELDLEIPRGQQAVTTVEGVLLSVIEGLSVDQDSRKANDPETFQKIQTIIEKLHEFAATKSPFTISIDDPSGKSKVESFKPLGIDENLTITHYNRTKEHMKMLGYTDEDNLEQQFVEEVYSFSDACPSCGSKCDTRMKQVDIPFFKEVIIMCTACDHCGYKSNDVKTGGEISALGKRITLKLTCPEDLSRDILVSETCKLEIPEIDFETRGGSAGGKFTTLEGLVDSILTELKDKVSIHVGDSSDQRSKFESLLKSLEAIRNAEYFVTIVLTDPLANSYIQNQYAPETDPNLEISEYKRTEEEDDDLGISTMDA